jgi:hypothetical protein
MNTLHTSALVQAKVKKWVERGNWLELGIALRRLTALGTSGKGWRVYNAVNLLSNVYGANISNEDALDLLYLAGEPKLIAERQKLDGINLQELMLIAAQLELDPSLTVQQLLNELMVA